MRRRFGRGRRGRETTRGGDIDAGRLLERLLESGLLPVEALEAASDDAVPAGLAALGAGTDAAGRVWVVGVSPASAADAVAAALVHAAGRPDRDALGEVLAIAPRFGLAARRLLDLLGEPPFPFRALEAPVLADAAGAVEPEPSAPIGLGVRQVLRQVADPAQRELLERAAESLIGLAAKHGGAVRGAGRALELIVLARPIAVLKADDAGPTIEMLQPRRAAEPLSRDGLAGVFDHLEGVVRKQLNDRRLREGEGGARERLLAPLADLLGLRAIVRWPRAGAAGDAVDVVGVDPDGHPVIAAAREQLDLGGLAAILESMAALRPELPQLLDEAPPPVLLDRPRLALAAERFEAGAERLLALLLRRQDVVLADIHGAGSRGPVIVRRALEPGLTPPAREAESAREAAAPAASPRPPAREARRGEPARSRRGRRRPRAAEVSPPTAEDAAAAPAPSEAKAPAGEQIEELSLFDLDEEPQDRAEDRGSRRRRRSRGRRRRRPGEAEPSEDEPEGEEGGAAEARGPARGRERRPRGAPVEAALESDDVDDADEALPGALAPLVSEIEELVEAEAPYDDEEEVEEDETDSTDARLRREREARRRARIAKVQPEPEPEQPAARAPRRRAAIVAHADRDALAAAVLLARDLRLLEGIWVYPQAELMTFFRGVATDLREETPIYVVGFTASPAREIIQAASLYSGRLTWIDHHSWPPEDLNAVREAIGADAVHVASGAGSALAAVLPLCTRRSRFSDKLVDVMTGRFSEHDFSRWGRLWWWRLGEIATRTGDRRGELEKLLAGRPSDLARDAESAPPPPLPREAEFVSGHDFRLVHFGGYALVVAEVPAELDLHLTSRILRERYAAQLSLTWRAGETCVVLGADDGASRRALDVGAMADHLAEKHDWIDALSDADHVARVAVPDLVERPDRIDAIVAEVAMGRSTLEG